jgi:HSP20 family molecular chaperone IbpA
MMEIRISQVHFPVCPLVVSNPHFGLLIQRKHRSQVLKFTEKDVTLILKVHISDIHLVKLNLQITPETVLIQGQPTEAAGVEGYFLPSGFQSLIPLPHRVHPEIYETEIHQDGLTIQLAKKLRVQPSQVRIPLSTANLSDCSKMCI